MEPDRTRGRNGMTPSWNERQNYMQPVNAHEPIDEADERQQKQMQRGDEQLSRGDLWVTGDHDRFIDERCDAKQIADPYLGQVLREGAGSAGFGCLWIHGNCSVLERNTNKKSIGGKLVASN